ncbi:MAG: tyrosine-type recombinase/integrase [Chloroflexota bacterium]|nr:tyrosine-type recombinase/integrase [Chloroflexota bacterium]
MILRRPKPTGFSQGRLGVLDHLPRGDFGAHPPRLPHVLRHSAAKLRRDAGASIEDVQSLLGHPSLAMTATYLRRLEGEEDAGGLPSRRRSVWKATRNA